jgi:hypothetical protein
MSQANIKVEGRGPLVPSFRIVGQSLKNETGAAAAVSAHRRPTGQRCSPSTL